VCIFAALIAPVILRMAKIAPAKTGDEQQKPREPKSGIAPER
jgi:hypothetical protein